MVKHAPNPNGMVVTFVCGPYRTRKTHFREWMVLITRRPYKAGRHLQHAFVQRADLMRLIAPPKAHFNTRAKLFGAVLFSWKHRIVDKWGTMQLSVGTGFFSPFCRSFNAVLTTSVSNVTRRPTGQMGFDKLARFGIG